MDSHKTVDQSMEKTLEDLLLKAKTQELKDSEEGLKYSLEAFSLAEKHKLPKYMAMSYIRIGRYHWVSGNFDESISNYINALQISNDINEVHTKADAFLGLGNVYATIEILDQAVNYYNSALLIAKEQGLDDMLAKILNNLGTLYEDLKNYEVALDYFQQCLDLSKSTKDTYSEMIAKVNMANVFLAMNDLDQSLEHISSAIEYGEKNNRVLLLAHCYHSIGTLYQKKTNYAKSIDYLLQGIAKAKECKDLYIQYRIDIELGTSYDLQNQFDRAQEFYKRALDHAKEIDMDELMPRVYEQTALFYERHHMQSETLENYKAYLQASKDVEENRRNERLNSIYNQARLSESLKETKIYQTLSEELEESYKSMHVLSKIGQSMTASLDLENILSQLYDNVNVVMDAEGLFVGLFDPKEEVLHFDWNIENNERLEDFTLKLDNEKSWMVYSFLHKETLKINNIEEEYKNYLKGRSNRSGQAMNSAMYSPLIVQDEVIGVFSIQSREKDSYTDSHKDIMQTLSSYLAIALKNAATTKELAKLNDLLKSKSEHDGLTGIPNRRLFDETYDRVWEQSLSSQKELSVLIIDIDNFKQFNDQYGHLVGDKVVKSVATLLDNSVQKNTQFVARYGGDEFIAVLENTNKEEALLFANTFRKGLTAINKELEIDIEVTVSVGIATCIATAGQSKQVPVYTADNQLYLSKANGKNRISAIRL